jgi:beta-phosphoglucomutase family hydrolase
VVTGVIFDLDGTLVDSEPNYFEAERLLLAGYGIRFDQAAKREYVGRGTREILESFRARYGIAADVETLTATKNRLYLELAAAGTRVFPEMRALLRLLTEAGHPLALASGSSTEVVDAVLAITGLREHFAVTLSADAVERGKPAPDLFLETARRLGVPPGRCVVLEDSEHGVEAARRAGMRCIAIPSLAGPALAGGFEHADLLFRGGMEAFSAETAFAWIECCRIRPDRTEGQPLRRQARVRRRSSVQPGGVFDGE